jgi:citrate lyase beta subunit
MSIETEIQETLAQLDAMLADAIATEEKERADKAVQDAQGGAISGARQVMRRIRGLDKLKLSS